MLPHEFNANGIEVDGGTAVGQQVRCLRRGTVQKLRVVQTSGALEGFTYCLYNTAAACQPNGLPLTTVTTTKGVAIAVNEKLYRITPLLVAASGDDSYVSGEGYPEDGISNLDMPYACLDDHDGNLLSASPTNASDSIYLLINAAGSGAKTFGYALTIMDPML